MEEMCRICLGHRKVLANIYSIVRVSQETLNLSSMIMHCAEVMVSEEDPLPKKICYKCMANLITAYEFKTLCEGSHRQLLSEEKVDSKEDIILYIKEDEVMDPKAEYIDEEAEILNEVAEILDEEVEILEEDAEILQEEAEILGEEAEILDEETGNFISHNLTEEKSQKQKNINALEMANIKDQMITRKHTKEMFKVTKSEGKKTYECLICKKILHSRYGHIVHTKIHMGIRSFKCPYENCKWSFNLKGSLEKHMLRHTDNRNYLCSICGKSYITNDSLTKHHKTTHLGVRPYVCALCDRTYTMKSHLDKHTLGAHSDYRPLICEVCGKGFLTRYHLKKHDRRYCGRGIKPQIRRNKFQMMRSRENQLQVQQQKFKQQQIQQQQIQQRQIEEQRSVDMKKENNSVYY